MVRACEEARVGACMGVQAAGGYKLWVTGCAGGLGSYVCGHYCHVIQVVVSGMQAHISYQWMRVWLVVVLNCDMRPADLIIVQTNGCETAALGCACLFGV